MNFCWTCPQYVWKTCGRLLWTGPRPLRAALPGLLGLPQWETGERNGKGWSPACDSPGQRRGSHRWPAFLTSSRPHELLMVPPAAPLWATGGGELPWLWPKGLWQGVGTLQAWLAEEQRARHAGAQSLPSSPSPSSGLPSRSPRLQMVWGQRVKPSSLWCKTDTPSLIAHVETFPGPSQH